MQQLMGDAGFTELTHVTLGELTVQLLIGVVLSLILQWHFTKFGTSISNRDELRVVIPFISLTTLLVISVVKSSLALSLGLVGALSIVRFRTPIKEPEELAYIFLAIAIGLGLGASQLWPTVVSLTVILVVVAFMRGRVTKSRDKRLFLSISIADSEIGVKQMNELLLKFTTSLDLQRFGSDEGQREFLYAIKPRDMNALDELILAVQKEHAGSSVNVVEPPRMPGL